VRLLYLANLNPNKLGSIEEQALFLSREMIRRGHECYLGFISLPAPDVGRLFKEAGAKILLIYCGNTPLVGNHSSFSLKQMLSLRAIVSKHGIDVVHFNFMNVSNPLLLGIYLGRAKVIFTEHASGVPLRRGLMKHLLTGFIHAFIGRRISKFIAISSYIQKRLLQTHHISPKKVLLLGNCVNLGRFHPADQNIARESLGLPIGKPIIGTVAMLIPEKGIQKLLEAVSLLVHHFGVTDLLALIVGDGPYLSELERLCSQLNIGSHVCFMGRRSDVHTIVAAADVIVVPSLWDEAFGLIIAEAMASGRPVVASRVGAIPELISNQETGLLVKPGDSNELAHGIIRLISDPEYSNRISSAALQYARNNFDLSSQVQSLAEIYEHTLFG
jgi:L-malate glycosyltransferase